MAISFQFSFWILIALAKICFFHIGHKPRKNIFVLVDKFLKKTEYPEVLRTYALPPQHMGREGICEFSRNGCRSLSGNDLP